MSDKAESTHTSGDGREYAIVPAEEIDGLRQLADDLIAYYDGQRPHRGLPDIIADLKAVRK